MNIKIIRKKGLAFITIILFVLINAISAVGNIETKVNQTLPQPLDDGAECYPIFTGPSGKNGWYLDDISIVFFYIPERVNKIFYRIDTEQWIEWNFLPFDFTKEGAYLLEYYWEDHTGNISEPPLPEGVKIDKTEPSLTLSKRVQSIRKKVVYTAKVKDIQSQIEKVEFYFDDELKETIEIGSDQGEAKYTLEYENGGHDPVEHTVSAIVYNYAGYTISESAGPISYPAFFFNRFLQKLNLINEFLLQFIEKILIN